MAHAWHSMPGIDSRWSQNPVIYMNGMTTEFTEGLARLNEAAHIVTSLNLTTFIALLFEGKLRISLHAKYCFVKLVNTQMLRILV